MKGSSLVMTSTIMADKNCHPKYAVEPLALSRTLLGQTFLTEGLCFFYLSIMYYIHHTSFLFT